MNHKYQTFPCPQCGTDNLATAPQAAAGIKCIQCSGGYIPVQIYQGGAAPKKSSAGALALLIILIVLVAIALGFVSVWLALLVGIFGLLAAILVQLIKLANKN